jgi:transcriptional regulator with XRE-family HTH domain
MNSVEEFDKLFELTKEEQLEHDAQMLAFQFLIRIDEVMENQNMPKKVLAEKVGTSASFITQLFRGDRKPSWAMLAKMQKVLNLKFNILTETELNNLIASEINDYHKKWNRKRAYEKSKGLAENFDSMMFVDNDYALAG